jgi:hypothetical protein
MSQNLGSVSACHTMSHFVDPLPPLNVWRNIWMVPNHEWHEVEMKQHKYEGGGAVIWRMLVELNLGKKRPSSKASKIVDSVHRGCPFVTTEIRIWDWCSSQLGSRDDLMVYFFIWDFQQILVKCWFRKHTVKRQNSPNPLKISYIDFDLYVSL